MSPTEHKPEDNRHKAYRPNAQAFDEIRLKTVPRYKTSEMSGDEWRISIVAQFFRNGKLMHEEWAGHNMEAAIPNLNIAFNKATGEGKACYGGEADYCDQEGCINKATHLYKKKKNWCSGCGGSRDVSGEETRKFCDRHKTRGDCGLDDADANYEDIT